MSGYNEALRERSEDRLALRLQGFSDELRGFAFEGAAMAIVLSDHLSIISRRRFSSFLLGPAKDHTYMAHVGAGWAVARLPWVRLRITAYLERFDPLLRWLLVDGYGFHAGYFHWRVFVQGQRLPPRLSGYARQAFDQGLGRSLWFIFGADTRAIARAIDVFPDGRQGDLWSGVGLAATYAGKVSPAALDFLRIASRTFFPHLAQGAAFAAKARLRADNVVDYTHQAVDRLCGLSVSRAAEVTDACQVSLCNSVADEPAYEQWRRGIRNWFIRREATVQGEQYEHCQSP